MGTMSNELIIETTELTKSYGPHVALDSLSIQVQQGATGLLGPNGAGKSTFFKTILGLIQATSGEGSVLGHDIRTEGLAIRSKIGYMPEYDALDDDMDAIHPSSIQWRIVGNESSCRNVQSTHRHGICRTWRIALSSNFVIFNRYEASDKTRMFHYS